MELREFDIANEIKTRVLLGGNLGNRTSRKIIDCFNNLSDESTLLIDITKANVIHYNFCSEAIGPLIKLLIKDDKEESKAVRKYMIVKVAPYQKIKLLDGILFYIYREKNTEDSEKPFIEHNLAIKLFNTHTNKLEFIGKRSEQQSNILDLINQKMEINAKDIAATIGITVEEAIENNLENLIKQFFVYTIKKNKEIFYCSFNNFLKEDSNVKLAE